jgi:hypothetical protein
MRGDQKNNRRRGRGRGWLGVCMIGIMGGRNLETGQRRVDQVHRNDEILRRIYLE